MPVPRMKDRKPNKERAAAFAAARAAAGFTSAAISAFGTRCKNEAKWNDSRTRTDARVGAHECQLIAQQAFSALDCTPSASVVGHASKAKGDRCTRCKARVRIRAFTGIRAPDASSG